MAMKSSYELPCELTICILTRLSVKDFLRFRCVSKSWRALIDDPFFVKKHLRRSIYESENNGVSCPGMLVCMEKCKIAKMEIIGTCNGLLCVSKQFDYGKMMFIWNPSTRESHTFPTRRLLPGSPVHDTYGFGYDRISDDYKVIHIYDSPNCILGTKIMVYSRKRKFWEIISSQDSPPLDELYIAGDHGTFVRSANSIYWDFQGKTKPPNEKKMYIFAGELRGCLCLYSLYSGSRHIWKEGEVRKIPSAHLIN